MNLIPDFLLFALIGGLGLAIVSAPLGVFMVWQRQSYFAATLAHSALFGISIGLFLQLDLTISVIAISVIIGALIFWLNQTKELSSDTLLGIMAHSSLALGLILISLQDAVQIDLMGYLFGDILSIKLSDLVLIALTGLLVSFFFLKQWKSMLNITLNAELAKVEGVQVKKVQLQFILLLAFMIALSMKIVGVLLVTSLLIIPAAAARPIAKSPEQMMLFSMLIGCLAVVTGIGSSFFVDIPTGPAIVTAATAMFLITNIKRWLSA
jgi:zinc transport system permease protein